MNNQELIKKLKSAEFIEKPSHGWLYSNNEFNRKIKELKTVTFGEMKNQVGTKFICKLLSGESTSMILQSPEQNQYYAYVPDFHYVYRIKDLDDDWPVVLVSE